jgi:hypothetical protein
VRLNDLVGSIARATSRNPAFRHMALAARDAKQHAAIRRLASLNSFERRVLSQNGEDGIIAELFARIPHHRYFVEIGVEDGSQCNTAVLARHYGWRGLMIEADPAMFERLKASYEAFPVRCTHLLVDRDNVAPVLRQSGVPHQFDLLSIDIDGNDYYVWEALAQFSPSVVVIEYNASFGRHASKVIAYNPKHSWSRNQYYGASLKALATLGERLGYALLGTDRRGINAFFVRRDLLRACGFPEKTAEETWRPNRLIKLLPQGSGAFFNPDT